MHHTMSVIQFQFSCQKSQFLFYGITHLPACINMSHQFNHTSYEWISQYNHMNKFMLKVFSKQISDLIVGWVGLIMLFATEFILVAVAFTKILKLALRNKLVCIAESGLLLVLLGLTFPLLSWSDGIIMNWSRMHVCNRGWNPCSISII